MAKRKPKSNTFRRKHGSKPLKDRVLIVTEGSKTEQIYFKGVKNLLKLSTTDIIVKDIRENTPSGIFKKAKELFTSSKKEGNAYTKVYCVFDKDGHPYYQETINNIKKSTSKDTFHAITSIPCFEYWLLLHFKNTSKPFNKCDEVCSELKKKIPNYAKGDENFFDRCKDKIRLACKHVQNDSGIAELTNVNELIKYLDNLSENTSILS